MERNDVKSMNEWIKRGQGQMSCSIIYTLIYIYVLDPWVHVSHSGQMVKGANAL